MRLEPPGGMRLASTAWAFALALAPLASTTAQAENAGCCSQQCCCPAAVAEACCPEAASQPCCSFTISTAAGPVQCDCVLVPAVPSGEVAASAQPAPADSLLTPHCASLAWLPDLVWQKPLSAPAAEHHGRDEYYAMLASTVLRI